MNVSFPSSSLPPSLSLLFFLEYLQWKGSSIEYVRTLHACKLYFIKCILPPNFSFFVDLMQDFSGFKFGLFHCNYRHYATLVSVDHPPISLYWHNRLGLSSENKVMVLSVVQFPFGIGTSFNKNEPLGIRIHPQYIFD